MEESGIGYLTELNLRERLHCAVMSRTLEEIINMKQNNTRYIILHFYGTEFLWRNLEEDKFCPLKHADSFRVVPICQARYFQVNNLKKKIANFHFREFRFLRGFITKNSVNIFAFLT
jgi:hypothetical protein